MGNSLDGQVMSDVRNVIRFYPVFSMQKRIDSVCVFIYYGGNRYWRSADCSADGKYWEASLPRFRLGQAIQRIEIEVRFDLDEWYRERFAMLRYQRDVLAAEARRIELEKQQVMKKGIEEIKTELENLGVTDAHVRILRIAKRKGEAAYRKAMDSVQSVLISAPDDTEKLRAFVTSILGEKMGAIENYDNYIAGLQEVRKNKSLNTDKVDTLIEAYLNAGQAYLSNFKSEKDRRSYTSTLESFTNSQAVLNIRIDSLKQQLAKEVEANLTDTLTFGPSVRKSDLTIDDDFQSAHLLYRNYKSSLRYMPALDPAERMGIFRARYVPFPIVGTQSSPRMNLKKPMSTSSPTVFEIGLAFGDAIVPGDEFVVPEFSWRRLGIAFAITERLFSDSAEVIGLALTYDFNSYGSIGIGGNFARNEVHGYASLGINKKAFEAVISGISKLFGK